MSEPTYQIIVREDQHEAFPELRCRAEVVRISDGLSVAAKYGPTIRHAREEAQRWIMREHGPKPEPRMYYATEEGELTDAPEPQSLKA